jgi:polyferredoxin
MKIVRLIIQIGFFAVFLMIVFNGNMALWLGVFIASVMLAALFGRFYCGYVCPMNLSMRITAKIAKKIHWQQEKVPKILKSKVLPWLVLMLMFTTMMLSKKILHRELPILIVLIILSVVVTLRYPEWVFHNHICPYGALLQITGKHAKFKTQVNHDQCIGCKKCEKVCPAQAIHVDPQTKKASVESSLCHQCQECSLVCPTNAIKYK